MRERRYLQALLPAAFLAALVTGGCASQQGANHPPAPPPPPATVPPEPPAEPFGPDPCTMTNSVSVIIDAASRQAIDKSFPKTHEVEVCKGRQSIVWYADGGKDLSLAIGQGQPAHGKPRGNFLGKLACGNVVDPNTGNLIGSLCSATVAGGSGSGWVPYTLTVSPKNAPNVPYIVDPQMIIKP